MNSIFHLEFILVNILRLIYYNFQLAINCALRHSPVHTVSRSLLGLLRKVRGPGDVPFVLLLEIAQVRSEPVWLQPRVPSRLDKPCGEMVHSPLPVRLRGAPLILLLSKYEIKM